jgi:transposase
MPEGHQRHFEQKGWDAAYFLGEAQKIGDCTHQYIGLVLLGKHFTEQTYNACLGLLRLGKAHTAPRLEAACKRALTGRTYTYRTIDNILKNNLDAEPGPGPAGLFSIPPHDNIRGPEAYQ